MYSLQTRLRRHMCTHMLVLYINWLMASETRPRRNFSQLSVSWVNLFGRSWIWQSSSSAANNTETNENISSTPFLSCLLCTLALSRSLLSLALCLDLSLSLSLMHTQPLHLPAIVLLLSRSPHFSLGPLGHPLFLPAQMVSVTPLSLNYSINYCGKMCN